MVSVVKFIGELLVSFIVILGMVMLLSNGWIVEVFGVILCGCVMESGVIRIFINSVNIKIECIGFFIVI